MIQDTNNEAANSCAAVAEGVDTADELPQPAWQFIGPDGEQRSAYSAEQMAQQREAGRREVDIRGLTERSDAWHAVCAVLDEVRPGWKWKQPEARNCMETAVATIRALARQPVSEGPTESQLDNLLLESGLVGVLGDHPDYEAQLIQFANAYAALSTIPPAKAEGISDTERLDFMVTESCRVEALALKSGTRYRLEWPDLDEAQPEWFDLPRSAIDTAILAQQATGEKK